MMMYARVYYYFRSEGVGGARAAKLISCDVDGWGWYQNRLVWDVQTVLDSPDLGYRNPDLLTSIFPTSVEEGG